MAVHHTLQVYLVHQILSEFGKPREFSNLGSQVGLAVRPAKPAGADTIVATLGVAAGRLVLAGIVQGALVHVLQAVATCPALRTGTGVAVVSVNTNSTILTEMAATVVIINLTKNTDCREERR